MKVGRGFTAARQQASRLAGLAGEMMVSSLCNGLKKRLFSLLLMTELLMMTDS